METKKSYTEKEFREKEKLETTIKAIFNKNKIPYILVEKANTLIAKWKILTGWEEQTANPLQNSILDDPL